MLLMILLFRGLSGDLFIVNTCFNRSRVSELEVGRNLHSTMILESHVSQHTESLYQCALML